MNRLSKPRSSTSRAKALMPLARSAPSPSQMYDGRNTPKRPMSLMVGWLLGQGGQSSASAVLRIALGKEGGRALEQVIGGEDRDGLLELGREAGLERCIAGDREEALHGPHGEWTAQCDLAADLGGSRCCAPGRHDLVDEPHPEGLLRRDDPAREDQLACARLPDDAWQALRPTGARDDREPHLRQAELCPLGRDPDVAAQRELEPAAERIALDRSDRRHREGREPAGDLRLGGEPGTAVRTPLLLELADVRPRGERAIAASAHDDRADVARIGRLEHRERLREIREQLARHEVERRVHELERRDLSERELDERGHLVVSAAVAGASPWSAASPATSA